jgi:hypothetical protein
MFLIKKKQKNNSDNAIRNSPSGNNTQGLHLKYQYAAYRENQRQKKIGERYCRKRNRPFFIAFIGKQKALDNGKCRGSKNPDTILIKSEVIVPLDEIEYPVAEGNQNEQGKQRHDQYKRKYGRQISIQ